MESRRRFLQLFLVAVGWLITGSGKAFTDDKSLDGRKMMGSEKWWLRNIFCQFDNEQLKQAIELCAKELDCTVFHGEKKSIDICAVGSFIRIIDRNIVGHGVWNEYIEGIDSSGGDVPCIIVDDIYDLPLPKCQYVYQLNLRKPKDVIKIVQTIKQMRKTMDKNIPDLFTIKIAEAS